VSLTPNLSLRIVGFCLAPDGMFPHNTLFKIKTMEAAPLFASTAITSGLPPIPSTEQARFDHLRPRQPRLDRRGGAGSERVGLPACAAKSDGSSSGQKYLIDRLLIALVANGHVLLEGVPGPGQDAGPADARRGRAGQVPAHPVHPRHAPGRHRRHQIYNPRDGTFNPRLGPVFTNFRPRGRNQPRAGQGPERAARIDAGNARSPSATPPTSCRNRSWSWPRKIRSSTKGTYPLLKRRSTGSCSRSSSPTPPAPRSGASSTPWPPRTPISPSPPVVTPEQILQARQVVNTIHVDDKVRELHRRPRHRDPRPESLQTRFPRLEFNMAPRRARPSPSPSPPAPTPSSTIAPMSRRRTSRKSPTDVLQHRGHRHLTRPKPKNLSSRDIVQKILDTCRCLEPPARHDSSPRAQSLFPTPPRRPRADLSGATPWTPPPPANPQESPPGSSCAPADSSPTPSRANTTPSSRGADGLR